jgi:hypothetical protein
MVVAGLPERVVALHAVPPDEHVLDRAVERVPHVQLARHVRRRHADDVRVVATLAGAGPVEPLLLPGPLPALLDTLRAVERLHGGRVYGGGPRRFRGVYAPGRRRITGDTCLLRRSFGMTTG